MAREITTMKFLNAEIRFRPVAVASHFVDGDQCVMNVERRIFESLCHHRTGELLPSHDKIEILGLLMLEIPRRLHEQNASKKIELGADAGSSDCILYIRAIAFRDVRAPDICPIDGQAGRHRYECFTQFFVPEIAGMTILFGKFGQPMHECFDFAGKEFVYDLPFSVAEDIDECAGASGPFGIELFELAIAGALDECAVYIVSEVIARRPLRTPVAGNLLVRSEDLFNDDITFR